MSDQNKLDLILPRRIALIGHSAAGKSACLIQLQENPLEADMDCVLGTKHCPSLQKAVDWLTQENPELKFVVISNHEEMLKAMHRAKKRGQYLSEFQFIQLVYLRKEKEILTQHLNLPTSGGTRRPTDHISYTLNNYERFDLMFRELADEIIECEDRSTPEIVEQIRNMANTENT